MGPDRQLRPVAIAVGDAHAVRRQSCVQVSQEILPPGTISRVHGIRVTSPLWSVAFEMRKAPSDEAAVVHAGIEAQRKKLIALRSDGTIGDAAFQRVEEELDWTELGWEQVVGK